MPFQECTFICNHGGYEAFQLVSLRCQRFSFARLFFPWKVLFPLSILGRLALSTNVFHFNEATCPLFVRLEDSFHAQSISSTVNCVYFRSYLGSIAPWISDTGAALCNSILVGDVSLFNPCLYWLLLHVDYWHHRWTPIIFKLCIFILPTVVLSQRIPFHPSHLRIPYFRFPLSSIGNILTSFYTSRGYKNLTHQDPQTYSFVLYPRWFASPPYTPPFYPASG